MARIIQRTRQAAKVALTGQARELAAERQRALAPLRARVAELTERLRSLQATLATEQKHGRMEQQQQRQDQMLRSAQFAAVQKAWEEETDKYFSQKAKMEKWLKQSLLEVAEFPGELTAGTSHGQIIRLAGTKVPYKILQDKEIKEPGFIFTAADFVIDASLKVYLQQKYDRYLLSLFDKLFPDE